MSDERPMTDDDSEAEGPLPFAREDAEWLIYEKDVVKSLASLGRNAEVAHNVKREGASGRTRQLDALIVGLLCGTKVEIAVEAKRYSKTVGIGVIDAFVGKCIDVGVNQGILYSYQGFSLGAAARAASAANPKIELRELPRVPTTILSDLEVDLLLAEMEPWETVIPKFLGVRRCPGEECFGEFIAIDDWDGGICDQCGAPVGVCQDCDGVTRIEWNDQQCDSCDAVFELQREHGSGLVTRIHWMRGFWDH